MLANRLLLLAQAETPPYRHGARALTLSVNRLFDSITVTAETLLPPPVWYDWYVDGVYFGRTQQNTMSFYCPDDQVQVEVLAVSSLAAPVAARTPAAARRTLYWLASPDDAVWYRVDQQSGATGAYPVRGSAWQGIGMVRAVLGQWDYTWVTDRLTDLMQYAWRIVPVDSGGSDGTPIVLATETVVRVPDAPSFTVTEAAGVVTFN